MGIARNAPVERFAVNRMKLSAFAASYWPDETSRPCTVTLKNHIKVGMLSGKKIGGQWFVECTCWNEPLYYHNQKIETEMPPPVFKTGNSKADSILNKWCN